VEQLLTEETDYSEKTCLAIIVCIRKLDRNPAVAAGEMKKSICELPYIYSRFFNVLIMVSKKVENLCTYIVM
jgi:hypothetical protein